MFEYQGRRWKLIENFCLQDVTGFLQSGGEYPFHMSNMVSFMGPEIEHYPGDTTLQKREAAEAEIAELFFLPCGDIVAWSHSFVSNVDIIELSAIIAFSTEAAALRALKFNSTRHRGDELIIEPCSFPKDGVSRVDLDNWTPPEHTEAADWAIAITARCKPVEKLTDPIADDVKTPCIPFDPQIHPVPDEWAPHKTSLVRGGPLAPFPGDGLGPIVSMNEGMKWRHGGFHLCENEEDIKRGARWIADYMSRDDGDTFL